MEQYYPYITVGIIWLIIGLSLGAMIWRTDEKALVSARNAEADLSSKLVAAKSAQALAEKSLSRCNAELVSAEKTISATGQELDAANDRIEELETNTAGMSLELKNEKKANEALHAENKVLAEKYEAEVRKTISVVTDEPAGFAIFRGSDARMRAIKKVVPKSVFNAMTKHVNDAIKAGQFAKWTNPPKPMTPKK